MYRNTPLRTCNGFFHTPAYFRILLGGEQKDKIKYDTPMRGIL